MRAEVHICQVWHREKQARLIIGNGNLQLRVRPKQNCFDVKEKKCSEVFRFRYTLSKSGKKLYCFCSHRSWHIIVTFQRKGFPVLEMGFVREMYYPFELSLKPILEIYP